jgi:hypothetical protein
MPCTAISGKYGPYRPIFRKRIVSTQLSPAVEACGAVMPTSTAVVLFG